MQYAVTKGKIIQSMAVPVNMQKIGGRKFSGLRGISKHQLQRTRQRLGFVGILNARVNHFSAMSRCILV